MKTTLSPSQQIHLMLPYQPPYNWEAMQQFLQLRRIDSLEWCTKDSYGRTFETPCSQYSNSICGHFTAHHRPEQMGFDVDIHLHTSPDEYQHQLMIDSISRLLDLNTDMSLVEHHLQQTCPRYLTLVSGLRLPGIWHLFEAGIRAILGQQISVVAAKNLVTQLVKHVGQPLPFNTSAHTHAVKLFPTPTALLQTDLSFLKIPNSRKQSLHNLAQHFIEHPSPEDTRAWLNLKGIGPWTIAYARMRGLSDPDILLEGDLGVKKALQHLLPHQDSLDFEVSQVSPWRSYLTLQLWGQLS